MSYDFTTLSPEDFEALTADLLSAAWNCQLEAFKPGKDGGVDLQHTRVVRGQQAIHIQCKRYAPHDFRQLARHMATERRKLDVLKPARYVLVTSTKLSRANKSQLVEILQPWVAGTRDIYGPTELNSLLRRHPQITKAHFKLWMSSTAALERILHSRIFNVTSDTVQEVQDQLCRLVVHDAFGRAQSALQRHHHCVIAGNPGIGKTTLAKMLLCHYMQEGFKPLVVVGDVADAWTTLTGQVVASEKQVVLYDDFLGQFSFEEVKFSKNEDASLVRFIEKVRTSPNLRFILTTREYLLAAARLTHGTFDRHADQIAQCTVLLDDYTKGHRAKILFNHLYFSDLPEERLRLLVEHRVYSQIIDHANFNPRGVERISKEASSRSMTDTEFLQFVRQRFDDPSELWDHAFLHEIGPMSRRVLAVLWSFGGTVELEVLRLATLQWPTTETSEEAALKFKFSLKELSSNFVVYQPYAHAWKRDFAVTMVRFQNPSIAEYVDRFMTQESAWLDSVAQSASRLEQVAHLVQWATRSPTKARGPTPVVTREFWSTLHQRGGPAEQTSSGYLWSRVHPAASVFSDGSLSSPLQNTLVFLRVAERSAADDSRAAELFERVTTKEGWSLLLKDLPTRPSYSYAIGSLVDWLLSSATWQTALPDVRTAFGAAFNELIQKATEWFDNISCLDILDEALRRLGHERNRDEMDFFVEELFRSAEALMVDETDPSELNDQLRALQRLASKSSVGESSSLVESMTLRVKSLQEEQSHGDTPDAETQRYVEPGSEHETLDVDALFASLLHR